MATISKMARNEISKKNPVFSSTRSTIETAFLRNNVVRVNSLKEAYKLACDSEGTIITDMPIYGPECVGLDSDSKVLLFNDGAVYGRCAAARRILGEPDVSENTYALKIREAVYKTRFKKMYHAQAYVGLHEDFMVKANLLVPEGFECILYNWLLNFQYMNESMVEMYKKSHKYSGEGDIFVFADPDWTHDEHPLGLSFFDPEHNCAALLGMRYFGEFKKGTLTLGWSIANRNGYAACHGGQKRYNLDNGRKFVAGVFGLSGSGKSTLTHAHHDEKYDVTVLHDDAFIISAKTGASIALEPSYFDKTADYPLSSPDNKFLLSAQNCGATIDEDGKVVMVTEDIRNGNGRAIKSKLWSQNRVNKFDEPVNAIFWLMKDSTLPPILKIKDSVLAATMGATLATKRSSAERLANGVDPNALVIEPYANPFRTYQLGRDYEKFVNLFNERNVDCYILNTGFFMENKISKEVTLGCLESVVEDKAIFKKWHKFEALEIMEIEGFVPNMDDEEYLIQLKERFKDRLDYIKSRDIEKGGYDKLPEETAKAIEKIVNSIF